MYTFLEFFQVVCNKIRFCLIISYTESKECAFD